MSAFSEQSLRKLFLVVLIAGFVVKIFAGYQIKDSFTKRGNSKTYLNALACNMYLHHEYSLTTGTPSVDYEPLYPALMSAGYALSGFNWLGITIIQALLHLLTSFLLFKIVTSLFNSLAGFFAALYHVCYPYLFTYSLSIYDHTLFVFLLVFLVYLIVSKPLNTSHLILAGIITGLAFLTRATILTFIPPVLLFIFYIRRKEKNFNHAFTGVVLYLSATALTLTPWLMRNYSYTDRFLISTHGSFGMWQGNNDYSEEYLRNDRSLDQIYRLNPPPEIYRQYPLAARSPKDAVIAADAYKKESVQWIENHFVQFVRMSFLKAQKLWSWNRNPQTVNLKFGSNEGRQWVYFVSYFPLLLLAPFGFVILYRKNKPVALLLAGILLCFTGAHMIAMGFTRARIPIDFILMMCSGITLAFVLTKFFPSLKFSLNDR